MLCSHTGDLFSDLSKIPKIITPVHLGVLKRERGNPDHKKERELNQTRSSQTIHQVPPACST